MKNQSFFIGIGAASAMALAALILPTFSFGQSVYVNPNAAFNNNVGQASASTQTTSAPTNQALIAQIQSLIAQINTLQAQGGSTASQIGANVQTNSACPQIGRTLRIGSTGDDVTRLQQFLARDPLIYPQGTVSGYYGALTQVAVQKWQAKFNIVSSGSAETTGYGVVGPRTASAIAIVCGGGSVNGVSGSSVVSGYTQISPISGNAPLPVAITATINTANSCTGATYTLNFGDGSATQQMSTAPGSCSQASQTFNHTYQYGGTYQVTLSSGSHQSTATVTVAGPPNPGGTGTSGNQPNGSINALITSGAAPLNVTFYISCTSGVAYDIVYGDGQELGSTGVSQSVCNNSLQSIAHTYASPGSYNAQLVIFSPGSTGAITPHTISTVGITVTGSTPSTPTLTPMSILGNQNGNPLAISVTFNMPNCPAFSLDWGDGTTPLSSSGGNCGGNSSLTYGHTYARAGVYTIKLVRGSQTNTAAVTISN